ARMVKTIFPLTPSAREYLSATKPGSAGADRRFLELVIHDDGLGIAPHFYNSKRKLSEPQLTDFDATKEWLWLNLAIELHRSSKTTPPAEPRRTVGVGLVAMLTALKQLSAFVELRTGRIRAFQWYRTDERVQDRYQLLPKGAPAPAVHLPGTVFRVFVPLPA